MTYVLQLRPSNESLNDSLAPIMLSKTLSAKLENAKAAELDRGIFASSLSPLDTWSTSVGGHFNYTVACCTMSKALTNVDKNVGMAPHNIWTTLVLSIGDVLSPLLKRFRRCSCEVRVSPRSCFVEDPILGF